jgi:hypothetical protein
MNAETYETVDLAEWRLHGRVRIVTLPDGRCAIVKDDEVVEVLP